MYQNILPGARATGIFANRPIAVDDRADMAAVAVIISRRMELRQRSYSALFAHVGS